MQVFVSFSATLALTEATGQLELHTESGAFAIPVPQCQYHAIIQAPHQRPSWQRIQLDRLHSELRGPVCAHLSRRHLVPVARINFVRQ